MSGFIRIKIDGAVVFPPIMPKVIREQTGCTVSMPSEGGRMSVDVMHRSSKEIERICAVLRNMVGVTLLDEDPTIAQTNGKAVPKTTGKK